MKQKHILKFFISCCFILQATTLFSQEKTEEKTETLAKAAIANADSTAVYKKNYGLRIGVDLARPILSLVKDDYKGFEIIGDYRIKKNLYIAAEVGAAKQYKRRDSYVFTGKGSYITTGVNWNTFKNWLEMDNEIYIGARYGFSLFDQTVEKYIINQKGTPIDGVPGSYFAPRTNSVPRTYENLTAHWMGLLFGFKVEVFNNLYLGTYVQYNFILAQTQPDNFRNLYIPGFNKVYSTNTGFTFGYSISYRIPFYKK